MSTAADRVAAWGDPAVVLRCGVAVPSAPTTQLLTIDGVDWIAEPSETGVTWTTTRRRVTVEVFVPKSYDSQGPLISDLAPAVKQADPAS